MEDKVYIGEKFWAYIAEDYNLQEGWAIVEGGKFELLDNDDENRHDEDYDNPEFKRVVGRQPDDALYQADKWIEVH